MKHAVLTSVAHNIADSLASGIGLMIGVYELDIFGEAAHSSEGFIEVDFLTGATTGAHPSPGLAKAVKLYAEALPDLCRKQGVSVADFEKLTARYSVVGLRGIFMVEIKDRRGRRSVDRYVGSPGSRTKVVDGLGRVRPLRGSG